MIRKLRKKVKDAVDERNDDYEELLMDLYAEVIVGNDDDVDIEVMNLLVDLVIEKFKGLSIMSG